MKLKLPQLALQLLSNLLEAQGWANTPALIHLGGQILVDVLPALEIPAKLAGAATLEIARKLDPKWCDKEREIELTDKQHAACVTAILHGIAKGLLPPGRYSKSLLEKFGIKAE